MIWTDTCFYSFQSNLAVVLDILTLQDKHCMYVDDKNIITLTEMCQRLTLLPVSKACTHQ